MEGLRNWACAVGITVVFGTMVESVMPGETYRKYIHLVLGLLLILTLLQPAVNIIERGGFDEYIEDYSAEGILTADKGAAEVESRQREDVIKIYKQTLESSIISGIESGCRVRPEFAEAEISDDTSGYGRIERVTVGMPEGAAADYAKIRGTVSELTGLPEDRIIIK